jgi:prepilin-type N-terminal cleavage/methylation domain-containing protein
MNTQSSAHSFTSHSRSKGFTLIELMIVVAIVAILTTIAYPNYRDYVIRGQLVDATQGLAAVRANMERYFQDNRTYVLVPGFPLPCDNVTPVVAGKFSISCVSTATTFTATAIGSAGTGALTGFTFTVDQNNVQKTVVAAPAPTSFKSCTTAWVTKTGGC